MAPPQESRSPQAILWELEGSFGSLACHAAMEIGDVLRSRGKCLDAVRLLAQAISDRLVDVSEAASPRSLLDPATVVAMNRAIRDSNVAAAPGTVTELIRQANEITGELRSLALDPTFMNGAGQARLEKIRAFCLSLSECALAQEHPAGDDYPQVPPEVLNDALACLCA